MIKEEEKAKVNSSQIKYLEKILEKIETEKQLLIDEFDLNAEKILGKDLIEQLLSEKERDSSEELVPTFTGIKKRVINTTIGKIEAPYCGILSSIHKSMIKSPILKQAYEMRLQSWFSSKTRKLRELLNDKNTSKEVNKYIPLAYSLASLAISTFHKLPNMNIRDVQILASLAMSNGNIAELGTGEGKTLSAILPAYLHALRGKGVHVITANNYLSKRDYEEVYPIFTGLGITVGYVPDNIEELAKTEGENFDALPFEKKLQLEKKLSALKKEAYASDITYGTKSAIAFDYLKDTTARTKDDLLQRKENPGLALIDEIDDVLIDDAQCPYILAESLPVYKNNMNLIDLANGIHVPYEELRQKLKEAGIKINPYEPLPFEKARSIAMNFYSKEMIKDQYTYQKRAQRFFETYIKPNIYVITENNEFGLNPERLYETLTMDEKDFDFSPRAKEIKRNSYIIYYKEAKKYEISDRCYEDFLTYTYLAFQLPSIVNDCKKAILEDSNYEEKKDYNIVNGNITLTRFGAYKIIKDANHPEILEDYNSYMSLVSTTSSGLIHYLNQAVAANLKMKSPTDYIVENGTVKLVKNGRVQEGTNYTDGLHQALELKENIERENMTNENETIATITQKDFYNRYDVFSGMTGTSSKSVFREIFGKETISIPRNAFYQFYSLRLRRKKRNKQIEPVGIEKKNTKFALNEDDKIRLIINSIKESKSKSPMEPVLLVVSNPEEIKILDRALDEAGIKHKLLDATIDKAKEAELIAKAGLEGAVTITTEMAGRGTDIKLGGDRETIIDIATARHIRNVEEKLKRRIKLTPYEKEEVRKQVEESLLNYKMPNGKRFLWSKEEEEYTRKSLEPIGLKVISSGFFEVERIDRQLEGRTGRNGNKGTCERYACPSDLEYLGVREIEFSKTVTEFFRGFDKNVDGSLNIGNKYLKKIKEKIKMIQTNHEKEVTENIIATQELSKVTARIIDTYRSERRKILFGDIDIDLKIQEIIEDTIDNLFMSYSKSKTITRDHLLESLSRGEIELDLETLALEMKQTLGVDIDIDSITEQDANLLEVRTALINYVLENHQNKKLANKEQEEKKEIEALLAANSYAMAKIPTVLTNSTTQKYLISLSPTAENYDEYYSSMMFYREYMSMKLEASKIATKQLLGVPLSLEEQKKLDERKQQIFSSHVQMDEKEQNYTFSSPLSLENDSQLIKRFRDLKSPLEKKESKKLEKANRKAKKVLEKDHTADVSHFYSNVKVRSMKFIGSLLDSKEKLVLVTGQPCLKEETLLKK